MYSKPSCILLHQFSAFTSLICCCFGTIALSWRVFVSSDFLPIRNHIMKMITSQQYITSQLWLSDEITEGKQSHSFIGRKLRTYTSYPANQVNVPCLVMLYWQFHCLTWQYSPLICANRVYPWLLEAECGWRFPSNVHIFHSHSAQTTDHNLFKNHQPHYSGNWAVSA